MKTAKFAQVLCLIAGFVGVLFVATRGDAQYSNERCIQSLCKNRPTIGNHSSCPFIGPYLDGCTFEQDPNTLTWCDVGDTKCKYANPAPKNWCPKGQCLSDPSMNCAGPTKNKCLDPLPEYPED